MVVINMFSIHYVHQYPLSQIAASKVNKCSYRTIIISQTSFKPYNFPTKVYISYIKVMTFARKNWKYINMLRISPLTVLAPLWLLSGMKNPFTVGKNYKIRVAPVLKLFSIAPTKATNLANLLNWTTAVSLKQIRTICQQPPAKAFKSWPRNFTFGRKQ